MLSELTADTFAGLVQTWFRMQTDDGPVELALVEVESLPPVPGIARQPFRLVFRSRDPRQVYRQATYRFEHDSLGALDIFVVPRGPDSERQGMIYDALFS